MKVKALFDRVFADWELQERRSIPTMRAQAQHVIRLLGDREATKLTMDDVQQYQLQRKRDGMANATINRELATLKRAYKLANQAGVVRFTPAIAKLKEENVRQGTYTREEAERLWHELPPYYADMARYAYFTGRRKGEIAQLRWEDVDFGRRLITVRQATAKNGQPDQIPMEGELYALMERLFATRDSTVALVFHYRGKRIGNRTNLFHRATRRAGLQGRLFHDFRRTTTTDLTDAGVDQKTAMAITGHKTPSTFLRYQIVKKESVRNAMERLEEFRTGKVQKSKGAELARARELWPELP